MQKRDEAVDAAMTELWVFVKQPAATGRKHEGAAEGKGAAPPSKSPRRSAA